MNRPLLFSAIVLLLAACQTAPPEDAFRLTESTLELREIQTRGYDGIEEADILAASIGVLQDMGYVVDDVEHELGVLTASKKVDVTNKAQVAALLAFDIASCAFSSCGDTYKLAADEDTIRVTLVVKPGPPEISQYFVRVTMQRILRNKAEQVSLQETISDPETYQQLFDKLNKSLFLEQASS